MKTSPFKSILLSSTILLISTYAWGGQESSFCEGGTGTQLEINMCASEKFNAADATLNGLYKELMGQMETPEVKKIFRDSQRAWITFRDTACAFEVGPQEGSMWGGAFHNCLEYHTKKRIEDLKRYLSCSTAVCTR